MPTLLFTSGDDTYVANDPDTFHLTFLGGNDQLTVINGTVTASMGEGNDLATLRGGQSTVFGESGADRFDIFVEASVHGGGDADLFNIRGGGYHYVTGGDANDRFNFYAAAAMVFIHGDNHADDFFGYGQIISGDIHGDSGNDYFVLFSNAAGAVTLHGGTGNDVFRYHAGTSATFVENAAEGTDSVQVARGVDYTLAANFENISVQGFSGSSLVAASTLVGNSLANSINAHDNIDHIFGFDGNDRLFGKGANDDVWGGNGNDYLDGGPGQDSLRGEAGNDTINGRAGDDTMIGGAGDDIYYVDTAMDTVQESTGEGTDLIRSTVSLTLPDNVENGILSGGASMTGNAENNSITGNVFANTLTGTAGDDTLRGGDGDDMLIGDEFFSVAVSGDDTLSGGEGNDTIVGGPGQDTLTGGAGSDTFGFFDVLDTPGFPGDTITDFTSASGEGSDDEINLVFMDANSNVGGDQNFTLVGSFTGTAGELTITDDPASSAFWVRGDVDGDGFANFTITVIVDGGTLFADDIVL